MKKAIVVLTLFALLCVPMSASAQGIWDTIFGGGSGGQSTGAPAQAPEISVMGALESIINWLFAILLIVAVIFLIIAAFQFITAAGDAEKIKNARNFVLYALIGVAVAIAARGLVTLVRMIVG